MDLRTPLGDWPIAPAVLAAIGISALLYALGARNAQKAGVERRPHWWQGVAFGLGLLATLIALDSPLDGLASRWLWAHMIQDELLVMAAVPLLLLGAPLWPMWRALPLSVRRASLSWVIKQRWPRRLWQAVSHWLFAPVPALLLFIAGFSIWHLPALYDAAIEREPVHALERLTFFATALIFWAQIIPSRPLQPRLSYLMRLLYVGVCGMYSNALGSLFVFSTGPFYPYYVGLPRSAGSISALADQHLGGTALDVPGTLIFFVAVTALLWFWLREDERAGEKTPAAIKL